MLKYVHYVFMCLVKVIINSEYKMISLVHISVNLPLNGVSGQLAHYSKSGIVKDAHNLEGRGEALNTPPLVTLGHSTPPKQSYTRWRAKA